MLLPEQRSKWTRVRNIRTSRLSNAAQPQTLEPICIILMSKCSLMQCFEFRTSSLRSGYLKRSKAWGFKVRDKAFERNKHFVTYLGFCDEISQNRLTGKVQHYRIWSEPRSAIKPLNNICAGFGFSVHEVRQERLVTDDLLTCLPPPAYLTLHNTFPVSQTVLTLAPPSSVLPYPTDSMQITLQRNWITVQYCRLTGSNML